MNAVLRGVGQIYLQRSVAAGALFLVALALTDLAYAGAATAGSTLGLLLGRGLRAPRSALEGGLYGFNAALVALATVVFFERTLPALAIGLLGAALATVLFHLARARRWPVFTAPFVVTTWALLALLPQVRASAAPPPDGVLAIAARHVGEVVFLGGTLPGVLCLAGLFASSRRDGLLAAAASLLALVCAPLVTPAAFQSGLLGFNAVLAAIAVQQLRRDARWALAAALAATGLAALALAWSLPMLTAPFVLVASLATFRPRDAR